MPTDGRIEGIGNVLVVGGGIGGMAAAMALRRAGLDVEIVDIDPEWKVYGAGITITGPTLRAFRYLGLLDAIGREGFFTDGIRLFLYDGTLLAEQEPPPIEADLPPAGGIMRPKLHQLMSAEVLRLGVHVRLGISADRLVEETGGVEVVFSDGSTGRYGLVVGADGIYSPTRALIFPHAVRPDYIGQMSFRVVAPRPADMTKGEYFFGHDYAGGIIPCSPDEVYAYILLPEPNPGRVPDDEKAAYLRDLMADFGGSMAGIRESIGPDSSIVQRPFEHAFQPAPWHRGRVVLIGDAVHATTPHLASGAGIAVEDALVLAEELGRAHGDVEAGLQAFTARRLERCRFVVEKSAEIARRQLDHAPPQEIGMLMATAMAALAEPI